MSMHYRGLLLLAIFAVVAALLQAVPTAAAAAESGSEFAGMTPVRVADTRNGTGVPAGEVAARQTLAVPVAGFHGVPADAKAVSLNVTVTQPAGTGYATVYPCGEARPVASNLNFRAGQTVPNAVVVAPGSGGAVCLFTSAAAHLLVDINGHFPSTAVYEGIVPVRAADTRSGTGVARGEVAARQTLAVPVAGLHGVAADAGSVAVNVTVTGPQEGGWVTVWPCGQPRPNASNLNFTAGQTVPNAVIAGIGADDSICLYTTAATHLIVDVSGYATDAADYVPLVPDRVFDTRTDWDRTKLRGDRAVEIQVAEPGQLAAVALNVTVTQPDSSGWITVYPCAEGRPVASNLNFVRGQTAPNMVIAPVDADGYVCFYTSSTTHILSDINGVWTDPTNVPGQLAVGDVHSCALMESGLVRCWGANWNGQLGDGTTESSPWPVTVSGIRSAVSIAAGSWSSCAVIADGTVRCWGENSDGQLGDGSTTDRAAPVAVRGLSDAVEVAVSSSHSCARLDDGTVQCWGSNDRGQLGDGTTTDRRTPVAVLGLSDVVDVSVAGVVSCAVLGNGSVECWGATPWGAFSQPDAGPGVGGALQVATAGQHACALIADGTVQCWGNNSNGELGDGRTGVSRQTPAPVPGIATAVSVDADWSTTCATLADGAATCWGALSQQGGTSSPTPAEVAGLAGALDAQIGWGHFGALTSGEVQSWGYNDYGQLGDGTTVKRAVPVSAAV